MKQMHLVAVGGSYLAALLDHFELQITESQIILQKFSDAAGK